MRIIDCDGGRPSGRQRTTSLLFVQGSLSRVRARREPRTRIWRALIEEATVPQTPGKFALAVALRFSFSLFQVARSLLPSSTCFLIYSHDAMIVSWPSLRYRFLKLRCKPRDTDASPPGLAFSI